MIKKEFQVTLKFLCHGSGTAGVPRHLRKYLLLWRVSLRFRRDRKRPLCSALGNIVSPRWKVDDWRNRRHTSNAVRQAVYLHRDRNHCRRVPFFEPLIVFIFSIRVFNQLIFSNFFVLTGHPPQANQLASLEDYHLTLYT